MNRKLVLAAAVLTLGVMAMDDESYAGSSPAHFAHGYRYKQSEPYRKRPPAMAREAPPLGGGQPNVTCGYQGGPKSPTVCRVR